VVVIRYEGEGRAGMQEMLAPTSNIMVWGWARRSR